MTEVQIMDGQPPVRCWRWTHDCPACAFIGQLGKYDIYTCPGHGNPTVVARYGHDGAEYLSGPRLTVEGLEVCLAGTPYWES